MNEKRLFFGLEIQAPWPENFPNARIISEKYRHLTLAFLGKCDFNSLSKILENLPKPSSPIGVVGILDKPLFLSNVVAYHFMEFGNEIVSLYERIHDYLKINGYQMSKHNFLPHVTLGRGSFKESEWEEHFQQLPAIATNLNLYESLGDSTYNTIWQHEISPPFREFEHIADIAFKIFGTTPQEIHLNAQIALSFKCPEILPFLSFQSLESDISKIISSLNELISRADQEIGTPFKAVSYHGDIKGSNILSWEMIVDV